MDDVSSIDLKTMGKEVQQRQGEVEEKEDMLYEKASPKGKFSGKSLNALVQAVNRLTPLFGIKDTYPAFGGESMTELPAEFVRLLSMFKAAISDAIEEGILPEDAMIDLSVITDDNGIQALAGRIGMAAKSGGFKRFLNQKTGGAKPAPMEKEMEIEEGMSMDDMSSDKTEDLFASRM
jgi:hypothetical protein